MNKYYTTIFFSLALVITRAQYLSFPDTGATWNVTTGYYSGWPPDQAFDYHYYADGTMVLNNVTYTRISGGAQRWFLTVPPDDDMFPTGTMLIRTDTATGKVYWLYDNRELVIFDYAMQPGDTLSRWCPVVIDSVYTRYLFGANRRVQRYHRDPNYLGYIVEGMGCSDGIFMTDSLQWCWYSCNEWENNMTCFSYNNQTLHGNLTPASGSCFLPSDISEVPDGNKISLAPNPATTYLNLQLQQTPIAATVFELYDITGRIVLQQPLTAITNRVELNGVSKGIYLYQVVSEKEKAGAGKLIIE